MQESEYLSICDACDSVLLSPQATTERVAIPWLHVIREHPVLLKNYEGLVRPQSSARAVADHARRFARRAASGLRDLARSRKADGQPWFSGSSVPPRADVLFISHLLNPGSVAHDKDFFFGAVPEQLSKNGHAVLVALINHCGATPSSVREMWRGGPVPRVVLSASLGPGPELRAWRRLWREARTLKRSARAEPAPLRSRVLDRAAEEALSSASRTALRIGEQVRALVTTFGPRTIVVTHEGHAWERLAFAAARDVAPDIQCIGYQHSALFRLQHAVRRHLGARYNPDYVLTSGDVCRMQLEASRSLGDTPIRVLGSDRSLAERGGNADAGDPTGEYARTCLVLPEGIQSECDLLFDFSLRCAEGRPDVRFIWRLHPSVSFAELERANPRLLRLPPNITKSTASFQEDLSRSGWALYRGTTAVVQAVGARLHPVYLQVPGEMTIDPLYEMTAWKDTVSEPREFFAIMDRGARPSGVDLTQEEADARGYCARVFRPFDAKVLLEILGDREPARG